MIRWITENLGTAKYEDVYNGDYSIVDVRNLVDKSGNTSSAVLNKIDEAGSLLDQQKKVVICCDYGKSRSNSIAIGVVSKYLHCEFEDSLKMVLERTGERGIQIDTLDSVREALCGDSESKTIHVDKLGLLLSGGGDPCVDAIAARFENICKVVKVANQDFSALHDTLQLDHIVRGNRIGTFIHAGKPSSSYNQETMGATLSALKSVLDVCHKNNVRLIYFSSYSVFSGCKTPQMNASESLSVNPKGVHGETEAMCEMLIEVYRKNYKLSATIVRLGSVYGPSLDRPKMIYNFIQKAMNNQDIDTHEYINGQPVMDFIYIDDVVDAVSIVINTTVDELPVCNIASGIGTSTATIALLIRDIVGSNSKIGSYCVTSATSNIILDIETAKSVLHWKPMVDINNGLKNIIDNLEE